MSEEVEKLKQLIETQAELIAVQDKAIKVLTKELGLDKPKE